MAQYTLAGLQATKGALLVEFYSTTCKPCEALAPVVDQVARELGLPVVKVNVTAEPALARAMNVRGVPTLILLREGREVTRRTGYLGEFKLREMLT
jgi:thioredoxin-like negative regulator of GroEL